MDEQKEAELLATESSEFSEASIEEEIAEAWRIADMGDAEFQKEVLPEAISVEGTESTEESSFYFARFENFVSDLGVRHFRPQEFLLMGSSNGPGGSCAGRNSYPPDSSWAVMAPTARMLDEIRHRLDRPVAITSAYRADSYNRCIRGASLSQHKRFSAFDFVARGGSAAEWWRVAREVRGTDPAFTGGIGKYNSFVHIDTRGRNVDW